MKTLLIVVGACAAAACASSKPAERPDAPVEPVAPVVMIENPVEDPMSAESVAAAGEPSPSQAETEQAAKQEGYDQPVFRGVSAEEAATASFSAAKAEPNDKDATLEEPSSVTEPQADPARTADAQPTP